MVRESLVKKGAKRVNDLHVGLLGRSSNAISLTQATFLQNREDSRTMVFDVQPIPHVRAISIDRQTLSLTGVQNHKGDELFRKLIRPVIVGAVGCQNRQAKGVVISAPNDPPLPSKQNTDYWEHSGWTHKMRDPPP